MVKKSLSFCAFLFVSANAEYVQRDNFFKNLMGIDEPNFQKEYSEDPTPFISHSRETPTRPETYEILDDTGDYIYQAGFFKEFSISELRNASEKINKMGGGSFNVIEAINPLNQTYLRTVDVGAMQADLQYKDAVFQVASNFNALELVGPNDQMENITKYLLDKTQGPFASLSALPGLIYRHYYMFMNSKPQGEWQQTPQRQINFLDQTDIPVTNSYVTFGNDVFGITNYAVDKMKVGYHRDIQVTFGFMPDFSKFEKVTNPDQTVNQVFTAAINFGFGSRNNSIVLKRDPNNVKAIAQNIQNAAYEGTIRSAFVHGKKRVVLTMIGGGVFANDVAWIANAIEKNKELIKQSGMKVELVIFDSSRYHESDMKSFRGRMLKMVEDTGGTYIQYTQQKPAGVDLAKKVQASSLEMALTSLKDSLTNLTSTLQTR